MELVVIKPFDGLARGTVIADQNRIAQILGGEHAHCVVRVSASQIKEV